MIFSFIDYKSKLLPQSNSTFRSDDSPSMMITKINNISYEYQQRVPKLKRKDQFPLEWDKLKPKIISKPNDETIVSMKRAKYITDTRLK